MFPPFILCVPYSGSGKPAGDGADGAAATEIADPVDEKAQELVGTMSGDLQGLVEDDDEDEGGAHTLL